MDAYKRVHTIVDSHLTAIFLAPGTPTKLV